MTNKRTHDEYTQRRELAACGWELHQRDSVAFNSGSETPEHFVCKAVVAYYLRVQGYRVDSEVESSETGKEADIIAYGNDEPAFVVEVETNYGSDDVSKKLDDFVYNEPFVECYMIDPTELPQDMGEQLKWVQEELGGEL